MEFSKTITLDDWGTSPPWQSKANEAQLREPIGDRALWRAPAQTSPERETVVSEKKPLGVFS